MTKRRPGGGFVGIGGVIVAFLVMAVTPGRNATATPGTTNPPPRAPGILANDANRNIVMFGGRTYDDFGTPVYLGDTWMWDGVTWTERHPVSSPAPRAGYAMAYDAARRQVVLFGGYGAEYYGDTWTWDGEAWTEQHPVHSPGTAGLTMAYDAARRSIVATQFGIGSNDTWTWNGVDWTELDPVHDPLERTGPGMAYHGAGRQVVVFGGLYYFGEGQYVRDDTMIWNGSDWRTYGSEPRPIARFLPGMAYDATRHRTVLFGGMGAYGPRYQDMWSWDGQGWTHLLPAHQPLGRDSPGMAWDGTRKEIVLFGGTHYSGEYESYGDTWIWDGFDWTCVAGCA